MVPVITVRDGELVINRHECLAISELKKVATRIKGMPGDHDGRKKRMNTLEMTFVKFYSDSRLHSESVYAGYSKKVKVEKIKADIGLPDDWKPDDHVWAACDKYEEVLNDYIPTARVLNSFEKGLHVIADGNELTIERMADFMSTLKNLSREYRTESGDVDISAIENLRSAVGEMQTLISQFVKLAKDVPDMLQTIEGLRKTVRKEEGELKKKGREAMFNRENPKKIIK